MLTIKRTIYWKKQKTKQTKKVRNNSKTGKKVLSLHYILYNGVN